MIAAVITVIAVAAAYAEAHPSRGIYFTPPYQPPRTPAAELLLVVLESARLVPDALWERLELERASA